MGFDGIQPASGPFWLAPGASVGVIVWFGNPGDDKGAQWIMAHPIQGQPFTTLKVSDFRKILSYSDVSLNSEGDWDYDPDSAYYRYGVTVTNMGSEGVFFNLQGGGNT